MYHICNYQEHPILDGVILLWFILTALSLLFVMVDIHTTPESPVLKWGFVLVVAYTGPIGLFLYILGCREPLPGTHEQYVAAKWRQVLGSTIHCVAGDGVGILAGGVIASMLHLIRIEDIALEYLLGFGFGWTIFQALFMRDMAGGSYLRSLKTTFLPELLSMNFLMAGMIPTMAIAMLHLPESHDPTRPQFWFIMSMALLVGLITAYPMNWWLVYKQMKHGMMTVRPGLSAGRKQDGQQHAHVKNHDASSSHHDPEVKQEKSQLSYSVWWATLWSFIALAFGLGIASGFGAL